MKEVIRKRKFELGTYLLISIIGFIIGVIAMKDWFTSELVVSKVDILRPLTFSSLFMSGISIGCIFYSFNLNNEIHYKYVKVILQALLALVFFVFLAKYVQY